MRRLGRQGWEAVLADFNDVVRARSLDEAAASAQALRRGLDDLADLAPDLAAGVPDDPEALLALVARGRGVLDPIVPALAEVLRHWGAVGRPLWVVHDVQATLTDAAIRTAVGSRADGSSEALEGISFVDSQDDPRVQLADFLAGASRRIASQVLAGQADPGLVDLIAPYVSARSTWLDAWPRSGAPHALAPDGSARASDGAEARDPVARGVGRRHPEAGVDDPERPDGRRGGGRHVERVVGQRGAPRRAPLVAVAPQPHDRDVLGAAAAHVVEGPADELEAVAARDRWASGDGDAAGDARLAVDLPQPTHPGVVEHEHVVGEGADTVGVERVRGAGGHGPVRATNRAGDRVGWPLRVRRTTVSRSTLESVTHTARGVTTRSLRKPAPGTTVSPTTAPDDCVHRPDVSLGAEAADGPDQPGAAVEEEATERPTGGGREERAGGSGAQVAGEDASVGERADVEGGARARRDALRLGAVREEDPGREAAAGATLLGGGDGSGQCSDGDGGSRAEDEATRGGAMVHGVVVVHAPCCADARPEIETWTEDLCAGVPLHVAPAHPRRQVSDRLSGRGRASRASRPAGSRR